MNAREKEQRRAFECEIKIKTKKKYERKTHDDDEDMMKKRALLIKVRMYLFAIPYVYMK